MSEYGQAEVSEVLSKGPHALVSGVTGYGTSIAGDTGGKSTTANWWFSMLVDRGWKDYGVYFNPSGDGTGSPSIDADATVTNTQELAEAFADGARKIEFQPQSVTGEQEHENLLGFVRGMHNGAGFDAVVVHDEARFYCRTDSLAWFVARGSDVNCRSIVVTQHPWDIPEKIASNLHLKVWVGPLNEQAERWFKGMGLNGALAKVKENTAAYHFSVILGGTYVATVEPVPEEYV